MPDLVADAFTTANNFSSLWAHEENLMRRWFLRTLLCWIIFLPVFYFLLLPLLMDKLQTKMRNDAYNQCQAQLTQDKLVGQPNSPFSLTEAETYCRCAGDAITLTHDDLIALAKRERPERLENAMKPLVEACTATLQRGTGPAASTGAQGNVVETVTFK